MASNLPRYQPLATSNPQQVPGRFAPRGLPQCVEIPLQLAFVAGGADCIALEIDHHPSAALDERQVDHAFEQPSVFQAQVDRQFAMAARGGTCARQ